jgi:hypothetical protein
MNFFIIPPWFVLSFRGDMIGAPQRGDDGKTRWYEYSPVDHGRGMPPWRQFQTHKASSLAATVRTNRVFSLAEELDDRNRMSVVAWCESIFRHCVSRDLRKSQDKEYLGAGIAH